MEHGEFLRGEKLWLWGREVTFVGYHSIEDPSSTGPDVPEALVRRDGEMETRNVPVWILARDPAESFSRARRIPERLTGSWDWD